ncbi:MAG TPA: class I SAM-dependent methyltransferase [Pseudoxanthomonas sp.]
MAHPKTTSASGQQDGGTLSDNRRTIHSYERYARRYAAAVSPQPVGIDEEALRRMVDIVQPRGTVLEVGSGPGWDADYVESLGVAVRRTDVTQAFCEFQTERGKRIERLDVIEDDLGGLYDAVMALCVLLHIDRDLTDPVLRKVAGALRPEGVFLVSVREGEGELWETGEVSGEYHVVLWSRDAFVARLATAGLRVDWSARSVDTEGPWWTFLARRLP